MLILITLVLVSQVPDTVLEKGSHRQSRVHGGQGHGGEVPPVVDLQVNVPEQTSNVVEAMASF